MIERTLHSCWFGGPKTDLARKCRASWVRFAPGWAIREWDEAQARAELKDLPGFAFFEAALAAKRWAMASDWLRMAALWKEGGVYFDCDVELVAGLDGLCGGGPWVAGEWTSSGSTWQNPGSGLSLGKGSRVAWLMLEAYGRIAFDARRDMMPWINANLERAEAACGTAERPTVLPPEVLSPIDMRGRLRRTAETVGIHHYALSWGGPWRKTLQWVSWHGGRSLIDLAVRVKHIVSG